MRLIGIGGIRFELRDTHDYRATNTNISNEPPTSVIYLKVSFLPCDMKKITVLTPSSQSP